MNENGIKNTFYESRGIEKIKDNSQIRISA